MANLEGFDATEVAPTTDFSPIPAGEYLAMMIDSEMKPTKNGGGEYLNCALEIIDGEHRGRRLWDRLNLHNQNETAVKIAQATLSAICHAVNVMRPRDSVELHGKPMLIKVALEERDDKPGQWKNEVKGYLPPNGKAPATSQPPAHQMPRPAVSAAPAQAAKPPWKK